MMLYIQLQKDKKLEHVPTSVSLVILLSGLFMFMSFAVPFYRKDLQYGFIALSIEAFCLFSIRAIDILSITFGEHLFSYILPILLGHSIYVICFAIIYNKRYIQSRLKLGAQPHNQESYNWLKKKNLLVNTIDETDIPSKLNTNLENKDESR